MDKHAKNYFSSCGLRTSHNTAVAAHRLGTNEVIVLEFLYLSINYFSSVQFSSVTQSCWTLQPHEPQHSRPPCPSPNPRVHSNPCLLSRWCHPAISSSVVPFSSCPQSFLAPGSFLVSQLFAIRWPKYWSFSSASVFPKNIQGWFPLRMTCLKF